MKRSPPTDERLSPSRPRQYEGPRNNHKPAELIARLGRLMGEDVVYLISAPP